MLSKRPSKAERKRRKKEREKERLLLTKTERQQVKRRRKQQQKMERLLLKHQLLHEQRWRCYICGCGLNSRQRPTIEHVVPKSRGGSNEPRNLRIACQPCNVDKNDWRYAEVLLGFRLDEA